MRPSRSHSPQPLPLPLPPPPLSLPPSSSTVPHHRRHRASCGSSTSLSSASTVSSSSPPSSTRSPDRAASASTSVVPFSWERHPGIPKSSLSGLMISSSGSGGNAPIPLPPAPLIRRPSPRHRRQRRRRRADDGGARASADPFSAAFAECTRPEQDDGTTQTQHGKLYPTAGRSTPSSSTAVSGRAGRPWWIAGGGVVGLLDLYGCKSAIAVADGALLARRPIPARR